MMIKAFIIGRVLPLGAAGFFLQSSVSPIRPALNAFEAASATLAGEAPQHVDAAMPGTEGGPPLQVPTTAEGAANGAKASFSKFIDSIFGDHHKDGAQAQLDDIINDVKYHGHPPPTPEPQPQTPQQNAQQPAEAPKGKGGKEIKLTNTKHHG